MSFPLSLSPHWFEGLSFLPKPAALILVLQEHLAQIEESIRAGDEEDAEMLSGDLEVTQHLCEVAAAAKVLGSRENGTVINKVTVAGVEIGSIHIRHYVALDRV